MALYRALMLAAFASIGIVLHILACVENKDPWPLLIFMPYLLSLWPTCFVAMLGGELDSFGRPSHAACVLWLCCC